MKPGTPTGKIARRLGIAPTQKTVKVLSRRPNPPGVHGARRRGSRSVYSEQLIEKQKLRFQFMISEKALSRAYKRAKSMKGSTGDNLVQLLDQRLDATIYRSGVVRSVPAARQLITHRHVMVNGRRVYSPSYLVQAGDKITFSEKAKSFAFLKEGFGEGRPAAYISLDREALTLSRADAPQRQDLPIECKEQMVVEWYSR